MNPFRLFQRSFTKADYALLAVPVVIILLGTLLGVLVQDDLFAHYIDSLAVLACLIPILFVLAVIAVVKRFMKRKAGRLLVVLIAICGSSIFSIFIFDWVNGRMDILKNDAVVSYVAQAVPILDKIKNQTGSYPSTLPVSLLGQPPDLLLHFGDYSSDGKEFRFEYVDEPAGWAGGEGLLEFESTDRKWKDER
jgi:hypothetical protein